MFSHLKQVETLEALGIRYYKYWIHLGPSGSQASSTSAASSTMTISGRSSLKQDSMWHADKQERCGQNW